MNQILLIIGFCILAYLCGSIPFGKIIGESKIGDLKSVNPKQWERQYRSDKCISNSWLAKGGNYLVLDLTKAAIPVFLAKYVLQLDLQSGWQPNVILLAVIISALLGSIFPYLAKISRVAKE